MARAFQSNSGKRASAQPRFDHLRLQETLGFLLSDATRTMTRTFSARIGAHGVGMGIFQFLRILWEEDGLTQSQLAARTRMRGPSAADALYDLERRGLVRPRRRPQRSAKSVRPAHRRGTQAL